MPFYVITFSLRIDSEEWESLTISKRAYQNMLTFRVIIEKDEDSVLVAKVPALPGCAT
jgi:hypothetical protein